MRSKVDASNSLDGRPILGVRFYENFLLAGNFRCFLFYIREMESDRAFPREPARAPLYGSLHCVL